MKKKRSKYKQFFNLLNEKPKETIKKRKQKQKNQVSEFLCSVVSF